MLLGAVALPYIQASMLKSIGGLDGPLNASLLRAPLW